MLPRVTLMNAVSVDAHTDWLEIDLGLFYGLAADLQADAHLTGADTMLAAGDTDAGDDAVMEAAAPDAAGAVLAITDSVGRARGWRAWRRSGYWGRFVSLCTHATPAEHLEYLRRAGVDIIVAGEDRVDLRAALEQLAERYGVQSVHLDSGGALNGAMLRAGLVDAVRLLVLPRLVGGTSPKTFFRAPDLTAMDGAIPLKLSDVRTLEGGLLVLHYDVVKQA
ncbi:MAG: dihydrofolate reductase family protein [Anaerolineae bacterium]